MSHVLFEQFGLQPDFFLEIGVGAQNTQKILTKLIKVRIFIEIKM